MAPSCGGFMSTSQLFLSAPHLSQMHTAVVPFTWPSPETQSCHIPHKLGLCVWHWLNPHYRDQMLLQPVKSRLLLRWYVTKKQSKQSTISIIMKLFHIPIVLLLLSFQHYYDIKMTTVILVNRWAFMLAVCPPPWSALRPNHWKWSINSSVVENETRGHHTRLHIWNCRKNCNESCCQ